MKKTTRDKIYLELGKYVDNIIKSTGGKVSVDIERNMIDSLTDAVIKLYNELDKERSKNGKNLH